MGAYVLAVTGLRLEASIATRSPATKAVCSGGDTANLESLIEAAVGGACRGIISFGVAGALWPGLRPGACLVATAVMHDRVRFSTDAQWSNRLTAKLAGCTFAAVAGVDQPLVAHSEKQALYAATGAAGVDMESHVAARVAERHGLPLAVLRVVADPQERSLPPAALAGMRSDGSTDTVAVLRALRSDPAQIGQLVRVAMDAGRAFYTLLRCHRRLGAGLGLFDLG